MYFDHKKERHELLEALIVKDKDFTVPSFTQVRKELTFKIVVNHSTYGSRLMGFNL